MPLHSKIWLIPVAASALPLLGNCAGGKFLGSSHAALRADQPAGEAAEPANTIVGNPIGGEGIFREDCLEPAKNLPSSVVDLKELWNWNPPDNVPRRNVTSAVAVGVLKAGDDFASIATMPRDNGEGDGNGAAPGSLVVLNAKTRSVRWQVDDVLFDTFNGAAIGNLMGARDLAVVAIDMSGHLRAYDPDGKSLWVSSESAWAPVAQPENGVWLSVYKPTIGIADLHADGQPEVIFGSSIFDGKTGRLVRRVDVSTVLGYQHSIVYDVDGDGTLELVGGAGVFDPRTGAKRCAFPNPMRFIAAARLRSTDAHATVIGGAATHFSDKIYAFDGVTCASVFTATRREALGGGPITIGDFTGDEVLDFGIAGAKWYQAFDASGKELWASPTKDGTSALTGSTVFDLNGDGKAEVIYNDEDFLRVYDGASGKTVYQTPNSSLTAAEFPVVADVFLDGQARIIVGANHNGYTSKGLPQFSGVRVFGSPDDNWIGTRRIWSQHAYFPELVNDDGSSRSGKEPPFWNKYVKSKHLLGFRQNLPVRSDKVPACK